MKPKLEYSNGLKWSDLFRYYWPGMSEDQIDFFLWELTPFPFCTAESIFDFAYEVYKTQIDSLGIAPPVTLDKGT